jgi:SAM-dependent methyltransferase
MTSSWDERYANGEYGDKAPDPLVIEAARISEPGCALDLACGLGRHARYLAGLGWNVTAVDSSAVAVRSLMERAVPKLDVVLADLERHEYAIASDGFDLIVDVLYLQRSLFAGIRAGVRRGGLFAGVFAMDGMNPAFLVAPDEIRRTFADWAILQYRETSGHAAILARRP